MKRQPHTKNQSTRAEARLCAHVGYSSKLLQQVPREESDDGVLGGNDLVRWIDVLLLDLALVGLVVCREILMDDDGARGAWESLPGE